MMFVETLVYLLMINCPYGIRMHSATSKNNVLPMMFYFFLRMGLGPLHYNIILNDNLQVELKSVLLADDSVFYAQSEHLGIPLFILNVFY